MQKWYRRNHTKQYKYLHHLMTGSRFVKKSRKKNICMIYYIFKWKIRFLQAIFSFTSISFCLIFFSSFCISFFFKPFQNNSVHYEINHHYFCWNTTAKRKLKCFWAPKTVFQSPKQPGYVTDMNRYCIVLSVKLYFPQPYKC